ncbi:neuronal acetylcholine receptor subunit beta-3-like [Liolophura sinensis]|uniref:neuronal acetylcholine receptor subunit beta-3-like n=1 Tax=Liolophura sinensis TaxID=3198878 RepID=UPI0031583400
MEPRENIIFTQHIETSQGQTQTPVSSVSNTPHNVSLVSNTPHNVSLVSNTPRNVSLVSNTPHNVSLVSNTPRNVSLVSNTPHNVSLVSNTPPVISVSNTPPVILVSNNPSSQLSIKHTPSSQLSIKHTFSSQPSIKHTPSSQLRTKHTSSHRNIKHTSSHLSIKHTISGQLSNKHISSQFSIKHSSSHHLCIKHTFSSQLRIKNTSSKLRIKQQRPTIAHDQKHDPQYSAHAQVPHKHLQSAQGQTANGSSQLTNKQRFPISDTTLLPAFEVREESDVEDDDEDDRIPDEQRLLNEIFTSNHYDESVRPVFNSSENVQVTFGFTLIQIMDMEEKNQVLVTNAWLEHEWMDERISWKPDNFSGLRVMRIPAKKLWLPDIVLYNNADDYTTGYMPSNAMVHFDGKVFWSPPARLRSSCKVDITFFPFDSQECRLKFGSWTYEKAQVDIFNKTPFVDVANYISNGEWQLTKYNVERNETVYTGTDSEIYPDVTIVLVIHRRILYYVLNIIFPCVWLSILSLLNFLLPPDEGEKITLGITVLLSYSVFMLLVAENMPSTSEFVPLIGIYLTLSMAVTCASVILTVMVLKLYHCSPNQREVPQWVRTLVLKGLARLVHCQCPKFKTKKKRRASGKIKDVKFKQETQDLRTRLMAESGPSTAVNVNTIPEMFMAHGENLTNEFRVGQMSDLTRQDSFSEAYTCEASARKTAIEDILNYLKLLVAKSDAEEFECEVINEWKQVALVVDRLLFWFFLTVTVASTLLILVIIPTLKNDYAVGL